MKRTISVLVLLLIASQALAVNVVGTPARINWGTGANPAAQNMNVNAAATVCALYWTWFGSTNGAGILSVTLGGVASATPVEIAMDTGNGEPAAGVAWWFSPTTGASVALDPAWDSAVGDGPTSIFVCFDDSLTTGMRDSEAVQSPAATLSITLTGLTAGDLVVKFDGAFSATPPQLSSGWTNIDTQTDNNAYSGRVSSIVATGTSQVCTGEDESFSGLVCIGIPDAGGGAASGLLRRRRAANDDNFERPIQVAVGF